MNFEEIKQLIELIHESNLMEFKMKDGEFELSIRTKEYGKLKSQKVVEVPQQYVPVSPAAPSVPPASTAPAPAVSQPQTEPAQEGGASEGGGASAENTENLIAIKSPIVGTFYRAPSPEKPPYIKVGDIIEVGSVVCIVEAMKLFNEIESEVAGRIVKVETEDASPVEYDTVLFWVDPNG